MELFKINNFSWILCFLIIIFKSKHYKKIEAKIDGGDIDPAMIFGGSGIELKTKAEEEGKRIADAVNIPWADVKFNFNGTVGSILLPLREMEIKFDKCEREEKTILRAIKRAERCFL